MSFSNRAARALEKRLKASLEGEVRFDSGTRALYTTDASNYRQIPIGIVLPKSKSDILETLRCCREFQAPILSRGGGTSIAGQSCNTAVILDTSKYINRVIKIDPDDKTAVVEPGLILDHLCKEASVYDLTFGPDPATHSRCTLGGMIGNNSCGVHSIESGKTSDNLIEMEIVTYDGQVLTVGKTPDSVLEIKERQEGRPGDIYRGLKRIRDHYGDLIRSRFPKLPRRVSGYNLDQLLPENGFDVARALVGTEGTCITILQAKLRLVPLQPCKSLFVLSYADLFHLADHVPHILPFKPSGLEGLNHLFVRNMKLKGMHRDELRLLPDGDAWLLVEFSAGTQEELREKTSLFERRMSRNAALLHCVAFTDPASIQAIWSVRESSFGASMFVPGKRDTFSGWEDAAVPPEQLGIYFRGLQKILDDFGYEAISYGHFGDGCIHSRIDFDLTSHQGVAAYRRFVDQASDLVVACGGSFSGEHGDGQATAELLPKMYGSELVRAFEEFKGIWDPKNRMNPGKVVKPYPLDSNLRTLAFQPIQSPNLHYQFKEDAGDFSKTVSRCIGIGKCRKTEGGVMCPSFMATQDEKDSPRGRAHILQEMMRGELLKEGWGSREVKEALDLCLSCKSCKSECPTNVDIATYKAEFLSHYFKSHRRPLASFGFASIHETAVFFSKVPWFYHALTQTPLIRSGFKLLAGLSPARSFPSLARENLKTWFAKRPKPSSSPKKVILWPDTFTTFFTPKRGIAAVSVLEKLGFEVIIPNEDICCGRPFYEQGFLSQAKAALRSSVQVLSRTEYQDYPVIGLEPGCTSVFKDELTALSGLPPGSQKLQERVFGFAEFVAPLVPKAPTVATSQKAVIHGHCHQRALGGMKGEKLLIDSLQAPVSILDSGCCGMAGSFGYENRHYALSMQIAEKGLWPLLRKQSRDTLVLADGYSCQTQIKEGIGIQAMHTAEWLNNFLKGCKYE